MFSRWMLFLVCSLICLFSFSAQNLLVAGSKPSFKTYKFQEYRVDFPGSWMPLAEETLLNYLGRYRKNAPNNPLWKDPAFARGWQIAKNSKKKNCMCIVYRLKNERNAGLDACMNGIMQGYIQHRSFIKDCVVKEKGELHVNQRQIKWFDVTMESEGVQLAIRHYVLLDSGYVYYIYFSTTPKSFSLVKKASKKIVQSFKIAHSYW